MEFTLTYRGPLRANRGAVEKHALRRHFHGQLRELWEESPLSGYKHLIAWPPNISKPSVIREVHGHRFAPLVSSQIDFVAALDILLLRPGAPGALVTQGGDLDNRLKTLLDALKVPSEPTALPSGSAPEAGEEPFFCLLEDDALVTALAIRTDRLLEPASPNEVLLVIRVRTGAVRSLISTLGL